MMSASDKKTSSPVRDQAAAGLGDLVEVSRWSELPPGTRLSNVALMLFVTTRKGPRVLTVTERRRVVGLVAGRVEKKDPTLWAAMAREYGEETGDRLPRLEHVRRFAWRGHTAIFVAATRERVGTGPPAPGSDGEVVDRRLTLVPHLHAAATESPGSGFRLRRCARASTLALLGALGLAPPRQPTAT
jgi:8-oxo-dGTP pyrophosphatase MutT (NUDIX family)